MSAVNTLLSPYTFQEILNSAVNLLGVSFLLTATTAFFGFAGYLVAGPMRGAFWNTNPRIIVFGFLQQLVYIASFILFLTSWSSLFQFVLFYLPVFLASLLNIRLLPRLQTFDSMLRYRNDPSKFKWPHYLGGLALVWIVFGIEGYSFILLNPSLPLISWLFLIYSYLLLLLQAALSQGILFQFQNSVYAKVTTEGKGEFEGFLVGRGSDHYLLSTKEGDTMILSHAITTIFALQPSKLPQNP